MFLLLVLGRSGGGGKALNAQSVGEEFQITYNDGACILTFKITNLDPKECSIINCDSHLDNITLTIPDEVVYDNNNYSVTSIGDSAFYFDYCLTSIAIPSSVASIGNDAFANCSSLNNVYIYRTAPATLGSNVFPSNVINIYVPSIALESYKDEEYWSDYSSNIIGMPTYTQTTDNGQRTTAWDGLKEGETEPSSTDHVAINANMTINSDASLSVNSFGYCSNDVRITIEDGGQLTCQQANGEVTVKRAIEGYNPESAANPSTEGDIIPGQGILIKTEAAGTLTINPTQPTTAKGQQPRAKSQQPMLSLNVSNGNYSDRAFVIFGEGVGFDKINHENKDIPMLYIPMSDADYAIAMIDDDVSEIPVSFETNSMGQFTITLKHENCKLEELYLLDKETGAKVNILEEEYTFMATSGDNPDRFVLVKSQSSQPEAQSNFAYINNGDIIIYGAEGNAHIDIYDVLGRRVYNTTGRDDVHIVSTDGYSASVYVIRLMDENGLRTQKVIIDKYRYEP